MAIRPQSKASINLATARKSDETASQLIFKASKPRKMPKYLIAVRNCEAETLTSRVEMSSMSSRVVDLEVERN